MNKSKVSFKEKNAPARNIFNLTKNSGEVVIFDENKLKRSIVLALRDAGIEDNPISNQLVDEVIKKLGEELNYRAGISSLDVREAVEIAFLERGLTQAAQKYHDFDLKEGENLSESMFENVKMTPADNQDETPPASSVGYLDKNAGDNLAHLEVEELIEPPELGGVYQPNSDFLRDSETEKSSQKVLPEDQRAIIRRFEIAGNSGLVGVGLDNLENPKDIFVYFEKTNLSESEKKLLSFFTGLVANAWKNNISLSSLLEKNYQEQLNLGLSQQTQANSTDSPGIADLIVFILDWLRNNF